MKKERLIGAIALGSVGLIASPVWSHGTNKNQSAIQEDNKMTSPRAQGGEQMGLSQQEISEAQKSLSGQGFQPGNIDGVMDEQTQQAIAEFQSEKNLPATGTLDEATADQLRIGMNSPSPDGADLLEQGRAPKAAPEGAPTLGYRTDSGNSDVTGGQ